MSTPDQAMQTQLANIETRTGKKPSQLFAILKKSGLEKHGEMVKLLKEDLSMGHGDANLIAHLFRNEGAPQPATGDDPLDAIYADAKAALRPLHDAVMAKVAKFGAFEIAPKKANVSLRRKKQFALLGPGSKGRLEIGINLKDAEGDERFVAQKAGGMCQFKVFVSSVKEVDAPLVAWLRRAFDAAGE